MQELALSEVVDRCAHESTRFTRGQEHDDRFCFELFRRAIVDGVGPAWEALINQYRGLVRDWLWQYALASSLDNHDDLVNRIFERFWRAVRPEKFARFPHLASLLGFLRTCVSSTVIDEIRAQRSWQLHRADSELADEVETASIDEQVLGEIGHTALWQRIEEVLRDPHDRLVIYLSYAMGLKPREIARRHAHLFPAVTEVHRRKRLALERLRRDPTLSSWTGRQ